MRTGDVVDGRYRLEDARGSGSGGTVWTAFDTKLKRVVALKRPHGVANSAERRQFRREAEIAAQVHHPNLIAVHDCVDDGWLVMENMAADSLDKIIATGPLPPDRVARIGVQIAGALAALHAQRIVHRDVKPGNILVGDNDLAKLTDFGISIWREVTGTDDGRISGTPGYTAPEVAGGLAAGAASDVFSLGATLYAALVGAPPFGTGDAVEVLARARDSEITVPDGPLAPLMTEMLDRKPKRRPTAEQVRLRLREIVGDWEPPSLPPARTPLWRRGLVQVTGAGLAVAGLTAAVLAVALPETGDGLIGDEHTADPCALLRASDFREFGPPELKPDWANFNRCDVLIDVGRNEKLDVEVQLATLASQRRDATWRTISAPPFEVLAIPLPDSECNRIVLVDDTYGVRVTATMEDSPKDLCRIADIAVETVREVLRAGPIPRRTEEFPPGSAAHINTCELLPDDALPGLTAGVNVFGGWSCKWYTAITKTGVHVRYDQHAARAEITGTLKPVGGRPAYLEKKDGECTFRVPYPPSNRPERALVDVLLVTVENDQPEDQRCATAEQLTKVAADNMNR
ncbi:serine/threonine-protein kinase [Actinokineospora iranica]|uniref:non-specific serine/threonine protein kinase n=1 Tax=Actinokineospora iranica TaxID=1271860 RepID=A0A1G6XR59_9PSEU|nr:serine/threonine-protein kinase [Actinokineospora iranica]SDD80658.1 Serine/threonine protein kinase [Actinokineospora iranica]